MKEAPSVFGSQRTYIHEVDNGSGWEGQVNKAIAKNASLEDLKKMLYDFSNQLKQKQATID